MRTSLRVGLRKLAGFTMVELMIVIAIIGVIAVAVLSAINPIEQINKGKDTRARSDASEILNALERMYATDEAYPFYDPTTDTWPAAVQEVAAPNDANAIADALETQHELKAGFANRIGAANGQNDIHIFQGTSEDQLYVCFLPDSQQFKREAMQKCVSNAANYGGNGGAICADNTDVEADNYFCMP